MQTTEKFDLKLFETTDPVLAEHFNHNTQAIHDVLAQSPKVVYGTYNGDDSGPKTLTFDTKPLVILLRGGPDTYLCFSGSGVANHFGTAGSLSTETVAWEGNSMRFTKNYQVANVASYSPYYYLAFCEQ